MLCNPARLGIISDTHGLLREEALRALTGSELIIHAGDVGKQEILQRLQTIAPVVAVKGNIDTTAWASGLPATAVIDTGPARIFVLHDLHELDFDPAGAGFRVVISGHSHTPSRTERDGVIYLNPGSAGPRRFRLPVTVARMQVDQSPWEIELVNLEVA